MKVGPTTCQWCFLYMSRNVIVSASSLIQELNAFLRHLLAQAVGPRHDFTVGLRLTRVGLLLLVKQRLNRAFVLGDVTS